jgi:hypothetical protein
MTKMGNDFNDFSPEMVDAIEKIMLEEDAKGYGQPLDPNPPWTILRWNPVPDTVGYNLYTGRQLNYIEERLGVDRKLRKAANKRKRQARARTGRRR